MSRNKWVIFLVLLACCGGRETARQLRVATPGSPARRQGRRLSAQQIGRSGPKGPATLRVSLRDVGLDPDALDRRADPCEDFYRFACGGWIDRTEIPPDRSRWIRSFSEIRKRNEQALKEILEEAAAGRLQGTLAAKVGRFYRACMDHSQAERNGLAPVESLLRTVDRIRGRRSLQEALVAFHRHQVWVLFDISPMVDFKDATRVIAALDQNGLGLPDRDYYLEDSARMKEIRAAYVAHVGAMLKLAGWRSGRAARAARDIMRLETELARASKTRVERRDPKGMYNPHDLGKLAARAPQIHWKGYFAALGLSEVRWVNVTAPRFFETIGRLVARVRPSTWRAYFRWHLLRVMANALPDRFVQEAFRFRRVLTGQRELRPRWKRCVSSTDRLLGDLLARLYVRRHFPERAKADARRLVLAIARAFDERLGELAWMDERTRRAAREKLRKMAYLIGYPERWKEYRFPIGPVHGANVLAARADELRRELDRVGKPVDRKRWEMTPPTVNAYYSSTKNQMVFPAGILQPPFYNPKAAVVVNLGGMGMVVGHELTHGFDDKGSLFDADGNLRNWWSPAVARKFRARTQCIVEQYSQYEAVPGARLNGKLTAGENIADLGGVLLAFRAYRSLRQGSEARIVADGYSEDQLFFMAMAQVWCAKVRDEEARRRAKLDPHSPPRWRVNGTLRNVPEFARAFQCRPGSFMNPARRCEVW